MKIRKMILGIAIILAIGLTVIACNKSGGGKTLNSPEALKEYLDKQPANSPDNPIKVSMAINDPMFEKVVDVIKSAGKYVSLNITGSALTTIESDDDWGVNKTLVSITIPNSVTSIEGHFIYFGLTSVTFQGMIDEDNFGYNAFPDDLREKYLAEGPGTYTTTNPGWQSEWTKK
jgi:hypothetical protein